MSSSAAAADSGAKEKEAKPSASRHKMRGRNKFLLILFSLILMAVLRTGFMFILIGLLPSIVTYYMDISKHRYVFKTIFACNLSGMMPYIGKIIHNGPSSAVLNDIMGTGSNWIIIYGSALIGWLLIQIGPMLAQSAVFGFHQTQISRIKHLQKKIEDEWGPEVTQFSHVPEQD